MYVIVFRRGVDTEFAVEFFERREWKAEEND